MCTPSNMCFLEPSCVHIPNGISIVSAVFCTAHGKVSLYCATGHPFPLKIVPLHTGIWTPSNTCFHGPTRVSPQPKRHLNQFNRFCRLTTVRDSCGFTVLHLTPYTIGHFGDVPQANLLAWYGKTKPNTTKAHIRQSTS